MVRKWRAPSCASDSSDTDPANLIAPQDQQNHTVLSKAQVLEIFHLKARASPKGTRLSSAISSSTVAKWYGVCSKTIRDIWMGRTWYRATHPLEPGREDSRERLSKQPGRPKGSKDSKPRTRRKSFNAPSTQRNRSHDLCFVDNSIQNSVLNFLDNCKTSEFIDPFHDDWPHW